MKTKLLIRYLLTFTFTACIMVNNLTQAQESHTYNSKKINENLYLISTGVPSETTQMGVVIGDSSILLIDSWIRGQGEYLLQAIRKISDKPIKYVINTHSHSDHNGGNKFFADLGATIISQENAPYAPAYGQLYFKNNLTLDLGTEQVEVIHKVSHTYDSVVIHLKNSNALFMGDNLATSGFLSLGEDGLSGQLAVFDFAISLSNENTVIIPGHASTSNSGKIAVSKKVLVDYKNKTIALVARLKTLHQRGDSLAAIKKDNELIELSRSFIISNANEADMQSQMDWSIGKTIELELYPQSEISKDVLALYEGSYSIGGKRVLKIFQRNNRLYIRETGIYMAELIQISEHHFEVKGFFFEGDKESLKFHLNDSNEVDSLNLVIKEGSRWGGVFNLKTWKRIK